MRIATTMLRAEVPALALDGELQADVAVDPEVAARKLGDLGDVAGHADVLIFPDLSSGNIAYKLVRALGGATAAGVVLQGYRFLASDVSRGATIDEIVATAAVLACLLA